MDRASLELCALLYIIIMLALYLTKGRHTERLSSLL